MIYYFKHFHMKIDNKFLILISLSVCFSLSSNESFADTKIMGSALPKHLAKEKKVNNVSTGYSNKDLEYYQSGQYDLAQQEFEKAIKYSNSTKNYKELSANLVNLGNAKSVLEQYDSAQKDYLDAAQIAEKYGYHDIAARAFSNIAKKDLILEQYASGEAYLNKAYSHCIQLPQSAEKAEIELGLGWLYLNHGFEKTKTETIYQLLTDAKKIANKLGLIEVESYAAGYLGNLYLNQLRLDEALRLTNQAEFLAQTVSRPDILYRWQWQNARILAKQGKVGLAISSYQQAISTLQPIRLTLRSHAFSGSSIKIDDLYSEYADLKMKDKQLSENDLLAVRDIIEQGKAVELESYYRDDCVSAWLNKSSSVDHLTNKTAALYPIMFADRLEILLSLPDGMRRYSTFKNKKEIKELASQFRNTLENRASPEYLPYAQALYDILIKPVQGDLTKNKIDTLVFIPDATFRTIPLAALHDGKDYLIKNYAIATSPGLTLTESHNINQNQSPALLAGLSQSSQGFQALPNVSEEIKRISGQFPATVLEDGAFRVEILRQQLLGKPYRIVHIASHGQFGTKSADTFILASDGKIKLDDLGKMLGVNRYRTEPVELLTLSACQTAAGDDQAALGLAGIAVKSGARSALASLWFINDPASADLVTEFYKQIKVSGTTKAKALQQAQWSLINDERYEHPGYWAPFLMIGNWL